MKHLIALALLLSAPAQSQMPRGLFPWWEGRFVRDVNLTSDQRGRIREILREHRGALIDQRAAVQKAEAEVEDLFNEEQVDQKKALDAIDRLIAARNEMARTYAQMSLKLRAVLTPEQWRELQRRRGDPARPKPQRKR